MVVVNHLGLHARAAAQLVKLAASFRSRIILVDTERNNVADAKSILSLLSLAAAIASELQLKVEGEDENAAFDAVVDIFRQGFGEI